MQIIETIKQTGALFVKVYKEIPETYNPAKGKKLAEVNKIVVTVNINGVDVRFDGDEISQNRLNRAFTVAKYKNKTIPWHTYDNEDVLLDAEQILDILDAAGTAQTVLWIPQA